MGSSAAGDAVFAKHRPGPEADGFFATEAAGLEWLRVPGGPPLPTVLAVGHGRIELERVATGPATPRAAAELGRQLAAVHAAGAPAFGAPPPAAPGPHGWIGELPMTYAARGSFGEFWAEDRVLATARLAARRRGLSAAQLAEMQRFADEIASGRIDLGPPEPPARLHGDLWSGNVLWGLDGHAWLVDPAAHGGHRESDLAMLALFGVPELERILAAYDEVAPLAPGWRARVPAHQVWPLLVHAALFGAGYGRQAVGAVAAARRG